MDKSEALRRIGEEWLIAIMRGSTAEETEAVCDALAAGGVTLIEVPYTTPSAGRVIRSVKARHGDRVLVSAGTVTTTDQAAEALDCGAGAIVSPNLFAPVVEFAVRHGVVSMPGCVTPTEIADALRLGADIIKLFPCYNLGPEYIGYMLGPFPGTRIAPAGKITLENMGEYRRAGAFAGIVGVTTEMGLLEAVRSRDLDRVERVARLFVEKAREVRQDSPR
jgi:2-dehydro-3-deoxyphosphogluconate aldolase/(4S)-4-hydroxy-2-oxoglutarate aldolase